VNANKDKRKQKEDYLSSERLNFFGNDVDYALESKIK
jgi:hypothetical protein